MIFLPWALQCCDYRSEPLASLMDLIFQPEFFDFIISAELKD
jgi:hypothetical protein